jgi:ribose transport system ATP-binding protein
MSRLEVREIVMEFPAVRALDGVSLAFEQGEVYGIIGENGAGKSTLMRILAGLQAPTSGQILWNGMEIRLRGVADALQRGIAMIHQELNLVDTLSAAENIFLGREKSRLGILDRREMNRRAKEFLGRVGASFGPDILVGELSIAGKQLVEIAKALSYEASVIIMDEPTAVLSDAEARSLFDLIGELRSKGVTVLYISHRLAEVEQICDRVTVLRDGKLVRTLSRGDAGQAELASLMVGRPLGDVFPPKAPPPRAEPALSVRGLGDGVRVMGVDFDLYPGEILGLAGLIGSGRTELAEMIVGIRKGGEIATSPRGAAERGLAYVSEDRKDAGLVLSMDVVENVTLANLGNYARPLIRRDREEAAARDWVAKLDIRVGDLRAPLLFLSGGNQQKVAIAKWLDLGPRVLILDEPTRGVDVGAKREIYQLVHDLAAKGMACLVISSELPELLGMCHRILVMRHGKIAGEVSGEGMTEEAIMMIAAGVEAA